MKKRIKPTFKSLTISEKIGVISIYTIGIIAGIAELITLYLKCPLFW